MRSRRAASALSLMLTILVASCAPPPAGPSSSSSSAPASSTAASPKRISVAMLGELPAFWDNINPAGGTVPGAGQFKALASAGLAILDENQAIHPQLGEAVPSTDNGLWKVFPDGRMALTFRIRDGARWHDGQPLTTSDLLFTAQVGRDTDVVVLTDPAYDLIDSVEAIDDRTVLVRWKQPYISADRMFGIGASMFAEPLPKHVLEPPFRQNKATLTDSPYWTTEFVGNGAYRLHEWAAGSHILLDAVPDYVLGKPRIDQIEVKMIPDPSTLLANVLAGSVDLTFSRSVSTEQAVAMRDQWRDGKMVPYINGWTMMYPQLRTPTPAALADAQFRRALVHAIDRRQLADTLTAGLAPAADSIIGPTAPEYRSVESSIVRYDYDPNRAGQILEGWASPAMRRACSAIRPGSGFRSKCARQQTTPTRRPPSPSSTISSGWASLASRSSSRYSGCRTGYSGRHIPGWSW